MTKTDYVDSRVVMQVRVPRPYLGKLHSDDTTVRVNDPMWHGAPNGKPLVEDDWQPPVREEHAEAS